MPRTPLLRAIRKLFQDAHIARRTGLALSDLPEMRAEALWKSRDKDADDAGALTGGSATGPAGRREIDRRSLLAAAGVGAGALAMGAPRLARAKGQPTIAIVGGGIAGLSCALKLSDHGYASTVYETSQRIGGRMFSNTTTWDQNQVSEWCGELIDTGHVTIQALAKRFRLPLDNLHKAEPKGSEDTYKFFGQYYLQSLATSQFLAKVAARVADDANNAGYPTTFDMSTTAGAILDAMSVYDWIESRVPGGHKSDLGQLLDVAYNIEYGSDTTDQSSLNLVYLLGFQPDTVSLSIFGASDETYHIRGGNQRLPVAMAKALGNVTYGYSMTKLATTSGGRYQITFATSGAPVAVTADYVVLALPFAVLRLLDTSKAGFDALKKEAISDLGRGRNGKTQLQFASRLWNQHGGWHGISNGSSYADTGYQSGWDVTRAQPGTAGIMVFYSGGSTTGAMVATQPYSDITGPGVQADVTTALARAEPVFPGLTEAWNGRATQSLPHLSTQFRLAYSYWRVGQYLAFSGYEGVAQGRVLFCGEHTSQNFQGYMEGGASEGQRAADDLIKSLRG
jgi:monoamine oxidase